MLTSNIVQFILAFIFIFNNTAAVVHQRKKKRRGRRNIQQLEYTVDYLIQHPEVATGKFTTLNTKNKLYGFWGKLANKFK